MQRFLEFKQMVNKNREAKNQEDQTNSKGIEDNKNELHDTNTANSTKDHFMKMAE